jgi:hypothetical protein
MHSCEPITARADMNQQSPNWPWERKKEVKEGMNEGRKEGRREERKKGRKETIINIEEIWWKWCHEWLREGGVTDQVGCPMIGVRTRGEWEKGRKKNVNRMNIEENRKLRGHTGVKGDDNARCKISS